MILLLILSILILGAGPLLHQVIARWAQAGHILEGFVLVSVGGLILVHVLPEAAASGGLGVFGFALAGLLLPLAGERVRAISHRSVHAVVFGGAMTFLVLHAMLDGLALGQAGQAGHMALAIAVVLHRLPVALGVWWLLRSEYGRSAAWVALVGVGFATVTGFLLEGHIHHLFEAQGFAYLQAFVAGSLLHVLAHQGGGHGHDHGHDHDHGHHLPGPPRPMWQTLGGALGAAVVVLLPIIEHAAGAHPPHEGGHSGALDGWGARFGELWLESAPALLLGYLLAGAFVALLPPASLKWMGRGGGLGQAMRGTLFGLPIPICSCGVVPLYRSLVSRGVPAGAALAFLVATPELGIEALVISVPLLGVKLTAARLLAAFAVALLVGWGLGRLVPPAQARPAGGDLFEARPRGFSAKLKAAGKFGLVEVVDDTAAWIIAGLAVAALFAPDSLPGVLAGLPAWADVVAFALLGLPLYVCASGATPLAAALIFAGASPGAAVAFLLAGPASNVTTFGVLSGLHGRRLAWGFGAAVVGLSIVAGVSINAALGPGYVTPLGHGGHGDHAGLLQWACALALIAVFAASLLRHGPRSWVLTVLSLGAHHSHAHDGLGECCGHQDSATERPLALKPLVPSAGMPIIKLPAPREDGHV